MSKTAIRKDDQVMVIAGKDKGKSGKVLRVIPDKGRVLVERVNMIKRHSKASQKTGKGGILEKEAPLSISNVMVVCAKCNKPARIGHKPLEDGTRARICRRCDELIDK